MVPSPRSFSICVLMAATPWSKCLGRMNRNPFVTVRPSSGPLALEIACETAVEPSGHPCQLSLRENRRSGKRGGVLRDDQVERLPLQHRRGFGVSDQQFQERLQDLLGMFQLVLPGCEWGCGEPIH